MLKDCYSSTILNFSTSGALSALQQELVPDSPPASSSKEYRKSLALGLFYKVQSTPDNSNLQGKLKMVRVIGSSSYRELRTIDQNYVKNGVHCI